MKTENRYELMENVIVYFNGDNEIRFRKGIWNYEEANLNTAPLPDKIKEAVIRIVELFDKGEVVDLKEIHAEFRLVGEEFGLVRQLMDSLEEQKYIEKADADFVKKFVKQLIGGTVSEFIAQEKVYVRPVLFVTDNDRIKEYAQMTGQDLGMSLTMMTKSEMEEIENADLLDRMDALDTVEALNELKRGIFAYSCVVVSLERPRLQFLRKLNRILLEESIPMVISIVDGPFLTVTSMKGQETACFECFENRVIARNEELECYKEFYKATGGKACRTNKSFITPILQSITSLAIFEAYLLASVNKCKLAGRVLNIYLPLIEIQIQDLYRIPYCPACGHIAKAKYNEMYTTSKEVVNQLVEAVMLETAAEREYREGSGQ